MVRWAFGVSLVVLILVVVVTQLAPGYVRGRLVEQLEERLATEVQVDSVEIHYFRLAATVHTLAFDDGRLAVSVGEVEVDAPWDIMVRGDARPTVVIRRPVVALSPNDTPIEAPEGSGSLDDFESLEVVDGSFSFRVVTNTGPSELVVTGISAYLDHPRLGSSQMATRVHAEASLPDGGSLVADGQVSSTQPRLAWRLRFELKRLQLAPFNNLWTDIVEMDVERGSLSAKGELLRTTAHLRGRVTPQFHDLLMLGPEEDAPHPMGEALFGHMLASANSTIEINRPLNAGSTLAFATLLSADWKELVAALIKRGYSRRLDTLVGYEAQIGEVEIDFGMGLLTLLDVQLVNESHAVDIPFVSVPRIDVVFDEQVTDRNARAYKHVTLWEPTLTFIVGETGKQSQVTFDEDWLDKISAIPFKTRDLVVHDGRVEYWDYRHEEPVGFFVSDIDLEGREMAADLHAPGHRGARLSGSGKVMGKGTATIDVAYEPRASMPNIDLDLFLLPLPLDALNPVLSTYAEVEAESGALGFSANIDARRLKVKASVVPTVVAPKLRKAPGARRNFRHVALERRIKKLRGRLIDLSYEMEPGEGVLHEFFPEFLIAAIRER